MYMYCYRVVQGFSVHEVGAAQVGTVSEAYSGPDQFHRLFGIFPRLARTLRLDIVKVGTVAIQELEEAAPDAMETLGDRVCNHALELAGMSLAVGVGQLRGGPLLRIKY